LSKVPVRLRFACGQSFLVLFLQLDGLSTSGLGFGRIWVGRVGVG
jgi:hypothetical protein